MAEITVCKKVMAFAMFIGYQISLSRTEPQRRLLLSLLPVQPLEIPRLRALSCVENATIKNNKFY